MNRRNFLIVGNKIMAECPTCGKLVRLDKPIFGSLHFCEPSYHALEAKAAIHNQLHRAGILGKPK